MCWSFKLGKIILVVATSLITVFIIAFFIAAMFADQPYWSKDDFRVSGTDEIMREFGDDFDALFKTNSDINQIINTSNSLSFIKERKAVLFSLNFKVSREGSGLIFSQIMLYYYSPIENEKYPTGQIIVDVFLPNMDVKYAVQGTFAKSHIRKDLIGIVEEEVVDGKRLEQLINNELIDSILPLDKNGYEHYVRFPFNQKISVDGVDYHD